MIVIAVLMALAAQDSAPAAAQAPATPLPSVEASGDRSQADPNREICRRRVASVGSNRTRRVCAPAWQWEQARQETRNELLRNSNGAANTPGATLGGEGPPGRGF